MKSVLKNLTLLGMGLMIYSCNEKISPELQSGSSTTIPTDIVPDEYYFRVTNASPVVLNYVLHRTGPGHAQTACKVSSSVMPFSSTLFEGQGAIAHDSKTYDISCFFEAEELSLHFNGISFNVEASKNTCEYIAYAPYSYFDAIPGTTTASWRGFTCGDGIGSPDAQSTIPLASVLNYTGVDNLGGATRLIGCDEMIDSSITVAANRVIKPIVTDAQPLCAFDYDTNGGGNGLNCDSGRMTFNFTEVYDSDSDPLVTVVATKPNPVAPHSCGGKANSCVGGAIKSVASLAQSIYGTEIIASTKDVNFDKNYALPDLMGVRSGNYDIVNFRRGLASMHLNFADYSAGNETQWADTNYNKAYDPSLMERYSANITPDNNYIIDPSGAALAAKKIELGYTATPLAADPFLGTTLATRVNPFYTFYCLDRAFEIKARIRMAIRDWDKVFISGSSDLELISDVYKNPSARRQDLPIAEEGIPNDPGNFNRFNDVNDWDVLLPMDRSDPNSIGTYDPGNTTWSPTDGWWDPGIFPNQGPPDTSSN